MNHRDLGHAPTKSLSVRKILQRAISVDVRHSVHVVALESRVTRALYLRLRPDLRAVSPSRNTQLVIEGFPRSANTYAVAGLSVSNPDLQMAHHLHSHRSVTDSVARGIPVILLLRDPIDAASSMVQKMGVSPRNALKEYVKFYGNLRSSIDRVVVAPFAQVTSDLSAVIDQVNSKYGMALNLLSGSSAEAEAIRDWIVQRHVARYGRVVPQAIALPSSEKGPARDHIRTSINREERLVSLAQEHYQRLMEESSWRE